MRYDEETCRAIAENIENAEYYGLEEVLLQMQEEAAELIQAISKYHRAAGHGVPVKMTVDEARQSIIEELVDVAVMTEQLRYFLDFRKNEPGFREIYRQKIRRTTERRQHADGGQHSEDRER